MTPAGFTAWRERMGFNISDAARELSVSRNWIMKFDSGESVVPRHVALACAALEKGIEQAK
jgi:predicted transcriptional regulator